MAADSRRQVPVLAGLLVVLAAVVWWQMSGSGPTTPATPTGRAAVARWKEKAAMFRIRL